MKKAKIKDLIPDNANFNKGTEFGNGLIDKSISKFGMGRSILIDKNDKIIAGNKTTENAVANGFENVRIIETDGTELIAVKRTDIDLNTKKGREMALADNATAKANIEWDIDNLVLWDMPTEEWGIAFESIDEPAGDADAEPQIDKAAELNKKWKVKAGDIWAIGSHRLVCGDSTNAETVAKVLDGAKVQMVFTDPPYGMFLDTSNSKRIAPKGDWVNVPKDYGQVIGDNEDFKPELIETIFTNFKDVPEVFVWGFDYFAELIPNRTDGAVIVWDKRATVETVEYTGSHFELCWSKQKHNRDIARIPWFGLIGTEQEHDHQRQHPTQKPTALAKWFIEKYSKADDCIVDVYAGSGFTLLACQNLNRKCYAIEISENYCAVILERMATAFPDIEIKRLDDAKSKAKNNG